DRAARAEHVHPYDLVAVTQHDAAHATGRTSHGSDVRLGETNGHTIARTDEHLVAAVGNLRRDDCVALFAVHRDDAARAWIAERGQFALLDLAALRPHDDELVFLELANGEQRGDAFAFLHRHEIGDRLSTAVGSDVGNLVDLQPVRATPVRENHDV